jgi:hypothetical protein
MSEIALGDLLEHLEGIGAQEIRALAAVGIYSVEDLDGSCAAGSAIAELSRRTGIADARLRRWIGRPLLAAAAPTAGAPDARVVLCGDNLGDAPDDGRLVLFQGRPASIEEWSPSRIVVRMPGVTGRGMLFAVVAGEATNAIEWEACGPRLEAGDITVEARALAGEPVRLRVPLRNDGTAATGPFDVLWEVGDQALTLPHGSLEPGQRSEESCLAYETVLPAGAHVVRFSAGEATAEIELRVTQPRELVVGVSDPLRPLDPSEPGPAGAGALVFGGPFAVAERVPGERLVLRAQAGQGPWPRLDRIVILALAPDEILRRLEAGELDAGRLPYDSALERRLTADGRWTVVRLPSHALDVQSRAVRERDAAMPDCGRNAHLWYVRD